MFTLTTDFNNGAISCDCNYDGSLSFDCNQFGGQCQCRQNVIGRRCELCEEGYYGFPRCISKNIFKLSTMLHVAKENILSSIIEK